ncbi:polysaccharide deacetylase family protein [Paenibacillus sp. NFR01]|uniref:polysaccharide deacetylase family protein n=1 Tax=Paenibacillus sp. NFR01 TaxID=1566279 RepID=UPI0008B51D78|nr:polysaccharide deacetylase family protein [Paenibacillus sp. NFR01]SET31414.1 Peptidoglycan/xylan/chitin deacetylase, PgdA/CDA1 family [Paenibacillus sp. NFR01]
MVNGRLIRKAVLAAFTALLAMGQICPLPGTAAAAAPAEHLREKQQAVVTKPSQQPTVPAQANAQSAAHRHKRSKGLTVSQLMRKYPGAISTQGPRRKIVALTFDDVPDPRYTPQLLDVLKRYRIKATFFVVGSRAKKHPELVRRMVSEGHVVGNHSYDHPQFSKASVSVFRTEILRTEHVLTPLTGYKPRLIRPPYGEIREPQLRWAKDHGYKIINWNVDSLDWRGLSKAQVRNNIISHTGRGAIILQHGGGGKGSDLRGTIQALPEVISILQKRGYVFMTVPQMLSVNKGK